MSNKQMFQILNIVAVIGTLIVNYLSNALPINGKTAGQLSDEIPNLFVPAGLTFAIWGVIYILLIMFAAYQARDLFKKEKIEMPFIKKTSYYFFLAGIANMSWIFAWHYQQVLASVIIMLVLFASLLKIYLNLDIGKEIVSRKERIFIQVPISVYLGWITVATIANITAFLVTINWDGLGISDVLWTMIVIIVALIITLLMIITRKDVAYSLVIVWALLGIYIKRTNPLYGLQNEVALTAAVCALIIVLAIIVEIGIDIFMRKK
ncbi:MAG: hypothetical protein AMQ22_01508 [Candidatus Methanofastidiosum methylothiophilum]|uniref:TspO/MBR family protein n=1 Tax=Candidatus Methanofastidiosum methylothiophilum TaxID=1705564 RepID=A0A150IZ09_9EURY|nr:MAG: hypothetical protein AMQ22_01508 [Candidatus Methanofastidiosum methylthiophilus]